MLLVVLVFEGFGKQEASHVASKLRVARKKSGIKVTELFKSMDSEHKGVYLGKILSAPYYR